MPRDMSASPRRGSRDQEDDHSGRRAKGYSRPDHERGYGYERDSGRRRRDKDDDDRHARHDDHHRRDDRRRDREREHRSSNRERDRKDQDDYDRQSGRGSRDHAVPSRRSASPERPFSSQRPDRARGSPRSQSRPAVDKAKPNFANSGLLAAETNAVKLTDGTSTILKYNEPPEARKPTLGWRLYVFKGSEQIGQCDMFLLNLALNYMQNCSI